MRTIMHVDMDAFFAAVEIRENPQLAGKPVIVGGTKNSKRGVVSTCSYEARKYGVHSAMPISRAVRLCPHGIFIPGNMKLYQEVSVQIRDVFHRFSPVVEPISIDEAFLDMTGCEHFYDSLTGMGKAVKHAIYQEVRLTASVGIAPSKFLAKLASDLNKPDGLLVINQSNLNGILLPLPVGKIPGVGKKAEHVLHKYGIQTVRDLRARPLSWLESKFGRHGRRLYELARGQDDRPVEPLRPAKSLGQETTFPTDIADRARLRQVLADLAARVGLRLRKAGLFARTVTVKARYRDFTTITRSHTLDSPFHDDDTLFDAGWQLLSQIPINQPLRLLGLYVSNLSEYQQLSLFDRQQDDLTVILDKLNARYDHPVIHKGRTFPDWKRKRTDS